ncbi:unnamed protein product, partial [Rotaria sp. Silwood1]
SKFDGDPEDLRIAQREDIQTLKLVNPKRYFPNFNNLQEDITDEYATHKIVKNLPHGYAFMHGTPAETFSHNWTT